MESNFYFSQIIQALNKIFYEQMKNENECECEKNKIVKNWKQTTHVYNYNFKIS